MYFQLNADYFNEQLGVFSKLDIDRIIPEKWKLAQWQDVAGLDPENYPVFIKPVWGQNSRGVERLDDVQALQNYREKHAGTPNIIQQAAMGKIEFEIFFIPAKEGFEKSILSLIQVMNDEDTDLPVNGVYNRYTHYQDQTHTLSECEKFKLYEIVKQFGKLNISRTSVKANSISDLLQEKFKVIEINMFLPMPLYLLCKNVSVKEKVAFVFRAMHQLVINTKYIPDEQKRKSIFFRKMKFLQQVKQEN